MTRLNQSDPRTHARDDLATTLVELSSAAATAVLPYFRSPLNVENKLDGSGTFDPVTRADREAEEAIRSLLEKLYPQDSILGEEFPAKKGEGEYCWVIDPIDGTRAFVCGLPTWATLIGLCKNGKPVFGVMSQPIVGEYFIGGMGKAEMYRNGRATRLATRNHTELSSSNLFATTPSMFDPNELRAFEALSGKVQMTRFGADSYAYCLLAAGHIDLVVESGLGFYDVAALIPLIEAAGGVVSDWSGTPVRQGGRVIAAANAQLHERALAILGRALGNR
ncbi:MAG: histidinol-phosphatase [Gammaproteobacteria bacterium]